MPDEGNTEKVWASPGARGRLFGVGLCLLLAGSAAARFLDWRSHRNDHLAILESVGLDLRDPEALAGVARERTPTHAKLATARAVVHDVLNPDPEVGAAAPEVVALLPTAQELARQALAREPASWQAAMLLGATIYLERSLAADPRLYTAYDDWEKPLLRAASLTTKAEPSRMLAAAYLECWPALSSDKKNFVKDILKDLFRRDPGSFVSLASSWIAAADDRAEALELVPNRPDSWYHLEQLYAQRSDWSSYCLVHARRLEALEHQLEADLEEAAQRLRLGDLANGRRLCLQVLISAPPSWRFQAKAVRALDLYPPGLYASRSREPLQEWLLWALELDSIGIETLPPRSVNRLVKALGDLAPPEAARAALLGGDTYRMERAENRADRRPGSEWAPYFVAKARALVRTRPDEAALELARATPGDVEIPYWQTRYAVVSALGDRQGIAEAERELRRLAGRQWSALTWQLRSSGASLLLLPEVPGTGLTLELLPSSPTGAAVEILWDGKVVAVQPVRRHQRIELSFAVEPRVHLLEIRTLAGQGVTPARVWLKGPTVTGERQLPG